MSTLISVALPLQPTRRRPAPTPFEQAVGPLRLSLYGVAMRLARNPADADDLVQETMMRGFRFWHQFSAGTNVKAWLFTILRNAHRQIYNRGRRRLAFDLDLAAQMRSLGHGFALAKSSSPRPPSAEDFVDAEIRKAIIDFALEQLPRDYATTIRLYDIDGLLYKEIADAMECPIGTVMSRLHRGRRLLRPILEEHVRVLGMLD
jgi:RNA polymerase sigma-70 factor (ECF subfamily)